MRSFLFFPAPLLLLFLYLRPVKTAEFCATSMSLLTSNEGTIDATCTRESFKDIQMPPRINSTQFNTNSCNIAFLLDLGKQFTSPEQYSIVVHFLYLTIKSCMDRGIGYNVVAYPMFDKDEAVTCCSVSTCVTEFGFMDYNVVVPEYESTDPIVNDSNAANFTYVLIGELKSVATKCLYNHVIMLSNRVFSSDRQDKLADDISKITTYDCITFAQVVVGRGDNVTQADLDRYYGNFTKERYLVPDYNCLLNLADCIGHCTSETGSIDCSGRNYTKCDVPTDPPLPTTTLPLPTTTFKDDLQAFWHVVYVFAISNHTSAADFKHAVKYIGDPLIKCKDAHPTVARFLSPHDGDSKWIQDLGTVEEYMAGLHDNPILLASRATDVYENETLSMMRRAINTPMGDDSSHEGPRIVLVTDFTSQTFIDAYVDNQDNILLLLEKFDFQVIAFNQETADVYRNRTVKPQHVIANPSFNETYPEIILCKLAPPDPPSNTLLIVLIICGSVAIFLLLLILGTCFFRQKMKLVDRLARLAHDVGVAGERLRSNNLTGRDDEIIDYWEMSWEDVIVKNDRLGHGAHGQVFRGKLRCSSPGVEHFFRPEDRVNYVNCEVAIKMLSVTSSDKSREEFLREIDLMKTLGFNDNIVNMLGCITTHKRLGLLLEYCAQGDLLRFLKRKKTELDESRSMDEQIDCTKRFMQFGYQIAHAMEFLQQQGIIHRDLAARNVLIDTWGNAKVGDFGLCMRCSGSGSVSSSSEESVVANGEGRLPIKWLAIECLQKQHFSFKSDVWSFGIVLYEMHSWGEAPFAEIEPADLLVHLLAGHRPPKPLIATDKMYEVMCRCWDAASEKRPSFGELLTIFTIFIEQAMEGYGYLQLIKCSEHYRPLPPVEREEESEEKKRKRSVSVGEENKEKTSSTFHPWKKMATAIKMRNILSSQEKQTSTSLDVVSRKKSTSAMNVSSGEGGSERAEKSKRAQRWDILSSTLGLDRRQRPQASSTNVVECVQSAPTERRAPLLAAIAQQALSTSDSLEPSSSSHISIDGPFVKPPIYFPRNRAETRLVIEDSLSSSPAESLASSQEYLGGRFPFRRRSLLQRHLSCPGRASLDDSVDSDSHKTTDAFQ